MSSVRVTLAAQVPGLQEIQWVATEELDPTWAERWTPPDADPARTAERTAFLDMFARAYFPVVWIVWTTEPATGLPSAARRL